MIQMVKMAKVHNFQKMTLDVQTPYLGIFKIKHSL